MAVNKALVILLHACMLFTSWSLPIDEAKQSVRLSINVLENYILSKMPGLKTLANNEKATPEMSEIYNLINVDMAELASVYTFIETEISLNEDNISDELVAISHVMKHTLEATCTWIKSMSFIDDEFECNPEILLLHKYREPVLQLKEALVSVQSSSSVRFCKYLHTKFNCDQNISDAVKQIVHSHVSKTICLKPSIANCE